ncbi:MAG: carboxypeptidase-like regulatory domain-containing protein, partial [Bdellovibrionales bacterium]|nr:carboxypeptidase-like regulatory domain-containing protein [Bdellovibrionales bacterium]
MKLYRFLIIYLFKLLSLPLAQTTVLLFLLFPLKFVCASEPGRISISIYKQNQTFKNFNVELNNKTFQTDEDGVLVQSFPEGIVQLKITHPDGEKVIEKNISVVSHLDTFVLINFDKDQVHFDINAPKVYEVEDKIENSVLFKGKVIAIGQEQELAGVKVFVKGLSQNATTNYRGEFELKVPKGKVLMSLSHSSYNTLSQEIEVNDDEQVFHKISMVPKGLELEDFIVLAPRQRGSVEELIQVRQNSTNVADVMSAEQMSK